MPVCYFMVSDQVSQLIIKVISGLFRMSSIGNTSRFDSLCFCTLFSVIKGSLRLVCHVQHFRASFRKWNKLLICYITRTFCSFQLYFPMQFIFMYMNVSQARVHGWNKCECGHNIPLSLSLCLFLFYLHLFVMVFLSEGRGQRKARLCCQICQSS